MIRDSKDKPDNDKIVIDLDGPQGNIYYIMRVIMRVASTLELDWEKIRDDMMKRSYIDNLKWIEREFGHFIIMYGNESLINQIQSDNGTEKR